MPPDISLHEIALGLESLAATIQISPATFKSVVTSFIDLLVEQQIPAIVWAKLPKGDVWQAELDRYTLCNLSKGVYLFKNAREEIADEVGMVSVPGIGEVLSSNLTRNADSATVSIALAPDSSLRREYFLLVWSAEFQGAVIARRPRTHATKIAAPEPEGTEPVSDESQERKQLLQAIATFDGEIVTKLLTGLEETLHESPQTSTPVIPWQQVLLETPQQPSNQQLWGQLFAYQLHKQEEIWQRHSSYRKQADLSETLQLHNTELSNAIRLKDDFINNVGQELRTPLTTIKTALSLLSSPNIKPPQRQRYMDLIAKECDRQSSLITSLLDLVQLDQMADQKAMEPLRLADLVPGVVSTYQPLAEEKGVMLAYTVPEDLPQVACVSSWVKQIVINLLHNGIKFTPRGGQVWVRAKSQGDFVQIEIRDTGVGIPANEIPKIFDRFYRVRQAAEDSSGAGLGLTIVQQLLVHCGGSISVKSKIGEGSTFSALLPVYKAP
jgi:two-component system phosphate regulon sensor histidine kinase PhoR